MRSPHRHGRGYEVNKKVDCECGVTITAATDDELYESVKKHAAEVHDTDISSDQALAMAKPA